MTDFESYDINENVSMEEFGRFTAINDRKAKLTNMVSIKRMANAGFDYKTNLLELKNLDDDYRAYVRLGNCNNKIIYEKRLAVVRKIEDLERVLATI